MQTMAQPITDSANLLREQKWLRTKGEVRNYLKLLLLMEVAV